ncbi:MAG: hypothetical protein KDD36_01375 [Flavobacteriales bacterium]|nr:hypothetical protein [Flavobacteriales bacterium]
MHRPRSYMYAFLVMLSCITVLSGCYKEKPTKAAITVVDVNNKPVADATVRLYCNTTNCIVDVTEQTGSDGTANFDFKNNTEYMLFIEAYKGALKSSPNNYISLQERKTGSLTVMIK